MLWIVQHLGALEVDHFHRHIDIRILLALPQHYLCQYHAGRSDLTRVAQQRLGVTCCL